MLANPNDTLPTVADTYIPVGSQVTVTIGRNIGNEPMGLDSWLLFSIAARRIVSDLIKPSMTFGPFEGMGEWAGHTEESRVFIFVSSYPASIASVHDALGRQKRAFKQDAIAWSYGPNLLAR